MIKFFGDKKVLRFENSYINMIDFESTFTIFIQNCKYNLYLQGFGHKLIEATFGHKESEKKRVPLRLGSQRSVFLREFGYRSGSNGNAFYGFFSWFSDGHLVLRERHSTL